VAKYRIEGVAKAVKAFKALPEVTRLHLGDAAQKTAFAIGQRAKALVPVRTGALKSKIGSSYSKATGVAKAGIEKGAVGDEIPSRIGHLVEFGHAGPSPAGPHPFMIPAAEAEREPFLDRCHRAGKEIERDLSQSGGLL
jgi:HK97 gp10 family phage protein